MATKIDANLIEIFPIGRLFWTVEVIETVTLKMRRYLRLHLRLVSTLYTELIILYHMVYTEFKPLTNI